MKYKTVIETDDYKNFEFFEDGNGKYIHGIYAGAVNNEWIALYFTECEQEIKIGHWVYDYTSADGHKTYHCSECGCYLQPKHSESLNSFKWCSLCGAKMAVSQERINKK